MSNTTTIAAGTQDMAWGSDYLAEVIAALGLRYVAMNPGASFRGLHDSFVNYLGARGPELLLCLHEEHAVALAHGYAKVAERPMAAFVHSNVGLMHASAGMFNAWCDRMPVMVLGATGAVDAARRRPFIEWIHTAQDQGALVRDFTKWDAQPASLAAASEALVRAHQLAQTAPRGPVYVNLVLDLQEAMLSTKPPPLPRLARFAPGQVVQPDPAQVVAIVDRLRTARRPLVLAGRVGRGKAAWDNRVAFAERLGIRVLTDMRVAVAFPTDHPLHVGPPSYMLSAAAIAALREADLILSLDWLDLGGTLSTAGVDSAAHIVQVSQDAHLHRGWSMDHQALPPADTYVMADPDAWLSAALSLLEPVREPPTGGGNPERAFERDAKDDGRLTPARFARVVFQSLAPHRASFARLSLSWVGDGSAFSDPLSYLGMDGGGTIGCGPGMAVGVALALRDLHPERLPVAVLGDGDFIMGCQAVWTAVRYRIPGLIVVANDHSYHNDELHQERVALQRGRPVENKGIGIHIRDPEVDLAGLARAQGAVALGPLTDAAGLGAALDEAVSQVRLGRFVVLDAHIIHPSG